MSILSSLTKLTHARNPRTHTADMLRELGSIGEAVLLLTATPLHLGSQDLFTLLQALRPSEFRDPLVFDRDLRHHHGVVEAGLLIRSRNVEKLTDAATRLRNVFRVVSKELEDPLAKQVIEEIESKPAHGSACMGRVGAEGSRPSSVVHDSNADSKERRTRTRPHSPRTCLSMLVDCRRGRYLQKTDQ